MCELAFLLAFVTIRSKLRVGLSLYQHYPLCNFAIFDHSFAIHAEMKIVNLMQLLSNRQLVRVRNVNHEKQGRLEILTCSMINFVEDYPTFVSESDSLFFVGPVCLWSLA